MVLLATIKASDVEVDAPDFNYASYKSRNAVRAIVFDNKKVALLNVVKHSYFMLPGGGADNEDLEAELARELAEELGATVEIKEFVGKTEVYFDRWSKKQTDYCFVAYIINKEKPSPTDFERSEGHAVIWANNLEHAINLVKSSKPENRDGKLVKARDLLFLETFNK